MELNLTHEESKKILELGYDFSPVCDRFIEELTRLKKPEYIEKEHFYIEVFRSEVDQHIKDSWIPLIPKAALEACLPTIILDTEQGRIYYLSFDGHKTPNYRYQHKTPDNIRTIYTDYESVFKAFLWCHEKYPEELKAKFEKVMK
jgi:hypothetical protein